MIVHLTMHPYTALTRTTVRKNIKDEQRMYPRQYTGEKHIYSKNTTNTRRLKDKNTNTLRGVKTTRNINRMEYILT